jgi:hypothetical protein
MLILQRQRILFSAYRADQYADAEGFMASLGVVFEQYPDDVIVYVTDPRTGIQRTSTFPPSIAEIVAACDARVAWLRRMERYRNWGKSNVQVLDSPREKRPTYDELIAKYGPKFGLDSNGGNIEATTGSVVSLNE